ncbi:hypothetical protein EPUL_004447 [Erysiphe pulchra]|uniref:Uncharacterized protein n=1 Tax=Erysiphe pulchra TaxID=225359 RepID=A0A2S4PVX8_9PEZI|nr:hypothetical protein EPUL_004447 [Erysiphe pulchra]
MQIQKEISKISVKSVCEEAEPYLETNLSSLASPTRGIRRKASHREKRSNRRDHLTQLAHSERVHPLFKLLAITSIPPLRNNGANIDKSKRSPFNAILEQISVSEKGCDFSTEGSPLDIFLSLQDEVNKVHEPANIKDNVRNETLSKIKYITSNHKKPIATHFQSPLSVPTTLGTSKVTSDQCTRRRRKPFYSPRQPCVFEDQPLFPVESSSINFDQDKSLNKPEEIKEISDFNDPPTRSKLALQIKLRTSFHSIKFALKSVSSQFNSPPVPIKSSRPTKFVDPDLSHTSECLPIHLESVATSQLRRYLNPITNAPIEEHSSTLCRTKRQRRCLVSIQMQTYKISASNEHSPHHVISYRTKTTGNVQSTKELVIRRRDMRENSDFLRVAVMEMLMRRRGKLDNQGPGKARLILPPRTLTIRPPETTAGGIPVRWISLPV